MRSLWQAVPSTFRQIFGVLADIAGAVVFLFSDLPALAGLPTLAIAGLLTLIGTLALVSVIADLNDENAQLRRGLDTRADLVAARLAFHELIEDGNDLARRLKAYRGSDSNAAAAAAKEFKRLVAEWNARCVDTVLRYVPHLAGQLGRPISSAPRPASGYVPGWPQWAATLRHEVAEKIDRMTVLQARLGE